MEDPLRFSSLYDWLEKRDRRTGIWFASRCALRSLSSIDPKTTNSPEPFDRLLLPAVRAVLCSAVASGYDNGWPVQLEANLRTSFQNTAILVDDVAPPSVHAIDASSLAARSSFAENFIDASGASALHSFSANSGSKEATLLDLETPLNWEPLWNEHPSLPGTFARLGEFWREWYQGFLDGKPLDWELQRRVALIPDADWERGPEHIAALIEEIRRDFDRPKLDAEQLTEQARRLAANPKSTEIVANSTADTIEQSVREFMRKEKLNELPETLAPLHRLPPLLRAMGATAQDETRLEELEKQIAQLVGEVARLTTELEAAKRVNVAKLAKETAVKTTVQIATAGFWGAVVAGFGHLTGIVDVGSMLERLGDIGSAPPLPEQLAPEAEPFTTDV